VQLPDGHYDGPDPDGFMPRDEMAFYLERYAAARVPVREHVDVTSIESPSKDGFVLHTSAGEVRADAVVVATGAFQRQHLPAAAATLPADLPQIGVYDYRNEQSLPAGRVLLVGSGQSGCQIAEELHDAGRDVVLACGRAPWLPRVIGDRDFVWWARETGFLDVRVEDLPSPEARLFGNVLASGHDRGHDLHLRTLQARGVVLTGHFLGAAGGQVRFASDLAESVAWGDERYRQFRDLVDELASKRGIESPVLADPEPFAADAPDSIPVAGFGAVIFAGGFRPDYLSWLSWHDAFDDWGFPIHREGASTVVPGLFFVGVHFLRKRKSTALIGVGEDAAIVARHVAKSRTA
jgi:putative flavoprotein involved in K+ transport